MPIALAARSDAPTVRQTWVTASKPPTAVVLADPASTPGQRCWAVTVNPSRSVNTAAAISGIGALGREPRRVHAYPAVGSSRSLSLPWPDKVLLIAFTSWRGLHWARRSRSANA